MTMNRVGKKVRNPKCRSKSRVINVGTESCAGRVQGRTGGSRTGGLTWLKEQNGPRDTQTRSHKKDVVWKGVCEHHIS